MDIANVSRVYSQANVAQQASLSVAKMAMDTSTQDMDNLGKMLQQSVQPHLGGSIDLKL